MIINSNTFKSFVRATENIKPLMPHNIYSDPVTIDMSSMCKCSAMLNRPSKDSVCILNKQHIRGWRVFSKETLIKEIINYLNT